MNKYQAYFVGPYEEMKKAISLYISDHSKVVDLGANNGNLEVEIDKVKSNCFVYCVDIDNAALKELSQRKFNSTQVEIISSDANKFITESKLENLDAILVNTTIHEINDFKDQEKYLKWFFNSMGKWLKTGGVVIIGDTYYPTYLKDSEVEKYRERQMRDIKHANAREMFVPPDLIKKVATANGFDLIYSNEVSAANEIDRRYVVSVLRKN